MKIYLVYHFNWIANNLSELSNGEIINNYFPQLSFEFSRINNI